MYGETPEAKASKARAKPLKKPVAAPKIAEDVVNKQEISGVSKMMEEGGDASTIKSLETQLEIVRTAAQSTNEQLKNITKERDAAQVRVMQLNDVIRERDGEVTARTEQMQALLSELQRGLEKKSGLFGGDAALREVVEQAVGMLESNLGLDKQK